MRGQTTRVQNVDFVASFKGFIFFDPYIKRHRTQNEEKYLFVPQIDRSMSFTLAEIGCHQYITFANESYTVLWQNVIQCEPGEGL